MKQIVVFGAGGAAKGCLQIISDINKQSRKYAFLGFLDENPDRHGTLFMGYPIFGDHTWFRENPNVGAVVGIADPFAKRKVVQRIRSLGHDCFVTIIHPTAWIADEIPIGVGSIVYAMATVNASARLGDFVLVNMHATIGHDSIIGDYATIAPGARVLGYARVGAGAQMGANSVLLHERTLGDWSILGAGSVAIQSIPSKSTAVGAPAEVIKNRSSGASGSVQQ